MRQYKALLAASPDVAKGLYKEGYNSEYKYSRLTTRSNIDINLTEDFKVSVNLAYRFEVRTAPYGYDADGTGSTASVRHVLPQFSSSIPNLKCEWDLCRRPMVYGDSIHS